MAHFDDEPEFVPHVGGVRLGFDAQNQQERNVRNFTAQRPNIIKRVLYTRHYAENRDNDNMPLFGDFVDVMSIARQQARHVIRTMKLTPMTLMVEATVRFVQPDQERIATPTFTTDARNGYIVNENTIARKTRDIVLNLIAQCDDFIQNGSGWIFNRITEFVIKVHRTNKPKGRSWIPMPPWVSAKKAVINVKNEDNKCFMWAVLAALHEVKNHPERVNHYTARVNTLKFDGIDFPVPLDDKVYKKFEKLNQGVSLYVYFADDDTKSIYPLYKSVQPGNDRKVADLLLYKDHYATVRDISKLLSSSLTKHNGRVYMCRNCMLNYTSEELLAKHEPDCHRNGPQKVELPSEQDRFIKFNNSVSQARHQFAVYADFESFITDINPVPEKETSIDVDAVTTNENVSFMIDEQKHVANSFCLHLVSDDPTLQLQPVVVHAVDDIIDRLMEELNKIYDFIKPKLCGIEPIKLTAEEELQHQNTKRCYTCNKAAYSLVQDHDHVTGRYRGAACFMCNLKMQQKKVLPVIFHNLKGYDSHIIIKGIKSGTIDAIPQTGEKFLSFTIDKKFKFIDSIRFMSYSLDALVSNLNTKSKDKLALFKNASLITKDLDKLELLTKKGIYPYEWVNCSAKFEETDLPPQDSFFSKLYGESVSDKDYEHAQTVWKAFDCKTFKEYHNLYLKLDVLLLADVFENFRAFCLENYHLEPVFYYSLPGMSWDGMLLYNLREHEKDNSKPYQLELLTDYTMYNMFEKGIRGGICQISHRYAESSIADSNAINQYIRYYDANNLYGWAMMQPSPIGEFKWEDVTDEMIQQILANPDDSDKGYTLEVDLEYPVELHDLHSDYPLAPEQRNITPNMISDYIVKKVKDNDLLIPKKNVKLVLSLDAKKEYVIYYSTLKLYLSLGLKLKKVHRIISYKQWPFLKGFIEFNTAQRAMAKTAFEKDLFKMMNNSLFGKTMESVRSHKDCKFVTIDENDPDSAQKAIKRFSSPFCNGFKLINANTMCYMMDKKKLVLKKPIYIGQAILDISKQHMYNFHYNCIKNWYPGDKSKLLFTDTDSLVYQLRSKDLNQDLALPHLAEWFDTSDLDKKHPLYSAKNMKVPGKFKDESHDEEIIEFVGLRSKVYSVLTQKNKEKKRLKGIKRNVVEKQISHQDYKDMLFSDEANKFNEFYIIRSREHILYTTHLKKISLSNTDDKRYLLDAVNSLPYGHYKIKKMQEERFRNGIDQDILNLIDEI